jgi:hypothetical protein
LYNEQTNTLSSLQSACLNLVKLKLKTLKTAKQWDGSEENDVLPRRSDPHQGKVSPPLGGYMSPSVNRSSESPESFGTTPPNSPDLQSQEPTMSSDDANKTNESTPMTDSPEAASSAIQRQQPIPPPSEPRQYRAIGLIQGQYMPSAEQMTRGTLLSSEGTLIDAVLLGRVMSLVKNHLDLSQNHLWVVYPRTRQLEEGLHVQIVGVWEPEKLGSPESDTEDSGAVVLGKSETDSASTTMQNGYFSIRGEVIYYSQEEEQLVIKIQQAPRRESEKTKFFKLNLKGNLGDRAVGHFWDLQVQLQKDVLVVQQATDIGLVPVKKRGKRPPFGNRPRSGNRPSSTPRPVRKDAPTAGTPPQRREVPKPIKRKDPPSDGQDS